jgi:Fumarylacetoacetate (FAA) hydrolase family
MLNWAEGGFHDLSRRLHGAGAWRASFDRSGLGDRDPGGVNVRSIEVYRSHGLPSRTITLVPGDIIATGTPAGVGGFKGLFLRDRRTVAVEIERLGAVRNPVRAA